MSPPKIGVQKQSREKDEIKLKDMLFSKKSIHNIEKMVQFTEEQKNLIEAPSNISICVSACPGSGKTTTTIHRIVYLVKNNIIPLKNIAMFTYNRSLGQDMSSKLRGLEIDTKEMFWCGTLHAYCFKSTNNYQDLKPWIDKYSSGKPIPNIDHLKYIIFDEYQDADEDMAGVIKLLSPNCTVMIVGDNRQQLYGYRGANIEHLYRIKDDFKEYTLTQSFRCNKNICHFLNCVWRGKDVAPMFSIIDGPKPTLYRSKGYSMNNPNIVTEIVKIVQEQRQGSIAIISPTVNSDNARRFLNDIHSNIYHQLGLTFDCYFNDLDRVEKTIESGYLMSSIHEVKGLEYDTVILLNAIDNKYFFDVPTYEAQCKFFVACSRPRQNLYIFEHQYFFMNGSICWISDNLSLFDLPDDEMWNKPHQSRIPDRHYKMDRTCRDFVRGLTNGQRRALINRYAAPTTLKKDIGLNKQVSTDLLEILFAVKAGFTIKFDYRAYLTLGDWQEVINNKKVPEHIVAKISLVFPYPNIIVTKAVDKDRTKLRVLYLDYSRWVTLPTELPDVNSMLELVEITENNVVSDYMCDEYYKNIGRAHQIRLNCSNIDEKFVQNLWWILRFNKLMDMHVLGFNQPDLAPEDIQSILNFINTAPLFKYLTPTSYHPIIKKPITLNGNEMTIHAHVDFELENGLLGFKCTNSDTFDDAWLYLMVYNLLAGPHKQTKYDTLYIYNAHSGTLYSRKLIT